MTETDYSRWGRVAEDGTVYVRTAGGERPVGSWHAGGRDAALAYYGRAYEDLAVAVALLEQRLDSGVGSPREVTAQAARIRDGLPTAKAVGDLDALAGRVDALLDRAEQRSSAARAERERAAADATARKAALAEEAESLAESTSWKGTGERFRAIVEEWKTIRGVDRQADGELWSRLAAARNRFSHRRDAHFATLSAQRDAVAARKRELVEEAERLTASTDWAATANRLRELMDAWRSAGRAGRPADDELWARFRAAQNAFFDRRGAAFREREAERQANLAAKEALLAEAEGLDPAAAQAQRRLREIQDRWDKVGPVPRESVRDLQARFDAAVDKARAAGRSRPRGPSVDSSPLVIRLRESVARLERKVERARAAGRPDEAAEAEQALSTQREWLARAERA